MTKPCIACGKPAKLLKVKSPEDGKDYLVNELCTNCIFNMGDAMAEKENPTLVCSRCSNKVFVLQKKECRPCIERGKALIDALPDWLEALEPPLGYYGTNEISEKWAVDIEYGSIDYRNDKPN